jgi:hypothetical protein
LSRDSLRAMYSTQNDRYNYFLERLEFENQRALDNFCLQTYLYPHDVELVARHTLSFGERRTLFVGPWLVPRMNQALRYRLAEQLTENAEQRNRNTSLAVNLRISPTDDLWRVARRFAGARDPERLVTQLAQWRIDQPVGDIERPLEYLLGGFIEDHLNRYDRNGANCARSSLSVSRQRHFEMPVRIDLLDEWLNEDYLSCEGPLETDDVVVIRNASGEPIHAYNFIGEEDGIRLAFTKNGFWRMVPYTYQDMDRVGSLYSRAGGVMQTHHRARCAMQVVWASRLPRWPSSVLAVTQ